MNVQAALRADWTHAPHVCLKHRSAEERSHGFSKAERTLVKRAGKNDV